MRLLQEMLLLLVAMLPCLLVARFKARLAVSDTPSTMSWAYLWAAGAVVSKALAAHGLSGEPQSAAAVPRQRRSCCA
jgi:hypothetical protein